MREPRERIGYFAVLIKTLKKGFPVRLAGREARFSPTSLQVLRVT
jgi:hypothetical protein